MSETSGIPAWGVPLLAVVIASTAIAYALVRNWIRRRRAESELLQLCHGDRSVLERLIAFEQDSTPGQSRAEAATAAAYVIKRDNR